MSYKYGSTSRARIDADAIDSTKLADDAVASEHVEDSGIISAAIADDAVTAAKLASGAAAANIGTGGVTSSMLASGAAAANLAGGTIGGALTINGDLTVSGTQTVTVAETVEIQDHNIKLDSNNSTSSVVDGAGFTIEGGSGDDITFQYLAASDRMELKKGSSFADIKVGTIVGTISGSSETADKLSTPRAIALSGDASGTANFDGSAGISITTTLATVPVAKGGTGATSAAAARSALGVDAAGTDNSTAVTLATVSGNYLSLSGQEITAGTVPTSLGGTGATSAPMVGLITAADASAARSVLDVDDKGTDNSTDVTLATVSSNYLSLSGQEITAGTVPVALGGTGATSTSAARTALGLAIDSDVQGYHARLASFKNLSVGGLASGDKGAVVFDNSGNQSIQKYNEFSASTPVKESNTTVFVSSGNASASAFTFFTRFSGSGASSGMTYTLPEITSNDAGKRMVFKCDNTADDYAITLDGYSSQTIDGQTTLVMNEEYQSVTLVATYGSSGEWCII